MSKEEFVQLWSKLTDEQKEDFLKELYHNMALYGLRALFYHEGEKVKLNEVKEYLSRIISFHDLMERLIKKYNAVSFEAGDELSIYVEGYELKDLVRKYLLPQLIKRK
jgi:two-component SAPR family response regulator